MSQIRKTWEGMKIMQEQVYGQSDDLKIRVAIASSIGEGSADVHQMEGTSVICAVEEEEGHSVIMIGDLDSQIHAVHAILHGLVGRIMSSENPMERILMYTTLLTSISHATDHFDPVVGTKYGESDE